MLPSVVKSQPEHCTTVETVLAQLLDVIARRAVGGRKRGHHAGTLECGRTYSSSRVSHHVPWKASLLPRKNHKGFTVAPALSKDDFHATRRTERSPPAACANTRAEQLHIHVSYFPTPIPRCVHTRTQPSRHKRRTTRNRWLQQPSLVKLSTQCQTS